MSHVRSFVRALVCAAGVLLICAGSLSADEPITLRYKAAEGDKFLYRTTSSIKQTQTIGEMELVNEMKHEDVAEHRFEGTDDQGRLKFTVENKRLKIEHDIAQLGKYVYDSTSNDRETGSVQSDALNPAFDRLNGAITSKSITPLGEVAEVSGFKELLADVLKENPLAAQFTGGGSDEAHKLSAAENLIRFREQPVRPGDQWEVPYETELPQLGKAVGKRTFTYAGTDTVNGRPTVKIDIIHDISFDIDLDAGGAKVSGTISTDSSSGTAQFDPDAGRLISLTTKHALSGTLTVDAGGNTVTVKSNQTQETAFELLENDK